MPKKTKSKNNDSKLFAFLAIFLSIIGFIVALLAKRDDKYVMFYAKQTLILFIAAVIVGIANMWLAWIPILGWITSFALSMGIFVLWIIALINSLSGKQKEIPLIGHYGKKINL